MKAITHCFALFALVLTACGPETAPDPVEPAGLVVEAQLKPRPDVDEVHIAAARVACPGEAADAVPPILEEATLVLRPLPGGARVGPFSAPVYFEVPAGCYDVWADAGDARGQPSKYCAPAIARGVKAFAGAINEFGLDLDCGPDVGAR